MHRRVATLTRWANAADYFAAMPLTGHEYRRGRALRVLGCRWAGEKGYHAWVLLFATSAAEDVVPPVGLTSSHRDLHIASQVALPYQGAASLPEGWRAAEIHIVMPTLEEPFSLVCAGTHAIVTPKRCVEHLQNSYAVISNAAADEDGYEEWFFAQRGSYGLEPCESGPLMSVVMPAFKTPPRLLREAIQSMCDQLYRRWELVVVNASPEDEAMRTVLADFSDDQRIRVIDLEENLGIAGNTNAGIAETRGDYVGFLDHDDLVEPEALLMYVRAIQERAARGLSTHLLYCDEDTINGVGHYCVPLFKPKKNIDLLYSNNYVIHWLTVSREVLDNAVRTPSELDGAQDYDLTFKAWELRDDIVHIPHVMYHWRVNAGSTNTNPDAKPYTQIAGLHAIEAHLVRRGVSGRVEREDQPFTYRTTFRSATLPAVTCYVWGGTPSDALVDAARSYEAVGGRVELTPLEVDSTASAGSAYARALESADADIVAFLPADIAVASDDFFDTAVGYFSRPEVAVVNPRVLRADDLVEYANAIVTPEGAILCLNRYLPAWDEGYIGRAIRPYDGSVANAGACFVSRDAYDAAGGIDAAFESADYAMADLCLRLRGRQMESVYTPFAEVKRSQPASHLGFSLAPEAQADRGLFLERYGADFAAGDPSHNPNFDPRDPYYRLREN